MYFILRHLSPELFFFFLQNIILMQTSADNYFFLNLWISIATQDGQNT